MEGGKDIVDKLRPHVKYTGMVYTYILNIFDYYNPRWPCIEVYPKLELVLLLSTSYVEVISLYMFCRSACNPSHPPPIIRSMWTSCGYNIYRFYNLNIN